MKKTQDTDIELMVGIRNDDYASYNKLFERYYVRLCQYVYSFLNEPQDMEDVVQELFLQLWNNRHKINIEENVAAYLYKMAKNSALNHLRTKTNYRSIVENQQEAFSYYEENTLETIEFRTALYDCINRLPERSKEIFLLHRVEGIKQKEISEKLAISIQTIKNQIWNSLQKLKKCLEKKKFNFFQICMVLFFISCVLLINRKLYGSGKTDRQPNY